MKWEESLVLITDSWSKITGRMGIKNQIE